MVDYFFIDFLKFYSLITITWLAPVYFGFFNFEHIRPYENVAYFLSGAIEVLNLLTLLKLLTFLVVKYLSIYHSSSLVELEEKHLSKIQSTISMSLVMIEYFTNTQNKNRFMIFNLLTTGNGGVGKPALVNVPIVVFCVLTAIVLQIRIEIDNYHYGDNAGFFLKMLQTFQNRTNQGKNMQKYAYLGISIFALLFTIFFGFLPLLQMSIFRIILAVITVTSLFIGPPILFILTHPKIKKFAYKSMKEKFRLPKFTRSNQIHSVQV